MYVQGYSPVLRRLLGDRKLSELVSAHPSVLVLEKTRGIASVGLKPGWKKILGQLAQTSGASSEVSKKTLVHMC